MESCLELLLPVSVSVSPPLEAAKLPVVLLESVASPLPPLGVVSSRELLACVELAAESSLPVWDRLGSLAVPVSC